MKIFLCIVGDTHIDEQVWMECKTTQEADERIKTWYQSLNDDDSVLYKAEDIHHPLGSEHIGCLSPLSDNHGAWCVHAMIVPMT